MQYKLVKGNQSNYEVVLELDEKDIQNYKTKILKDFQKELQLPWFRKWHVPLELVEKHIRPEYINAGIYEYAINEGLKKIMEENPNLKFIWNVYDLNEKEEKGKKIITFKIDVYPEVEILNENWKAIKTEKISTEPTDEEVQQVLKNLQSQYAEYKDREDITENSVIKAKLQFKNKKGEVVEEGTVFLWPEDFKENPELAKQLIWKKKNEEIEIQYSKKQLPPHLQTKDPKRRPAVLVIIPLDIKERIEPEINDEFVQKYFGQELKNKEKLLEKIKEELKKAKTEGGLVKFVDEYLQKVSESFKVEIPKTIIEEEIKTRMKSLVNRFGGEEGFKKYIETIGEDKAKKLIEDIQNASKESLKKFFILRKLVELLWIKDIDWNKPLDVEKKIYEKLTGDKIS